MSSASDTGGRFLPGLTWLAMVLLCVAGGCTGPVTVEHPMAGLRDPGQGPRVHLGAMEALDGDPDDEQYLDALKRVIWYPGYTVDTRLAAFERLKVHDLDGLQVTIRRYLSRINAWMWKQRLCDRIADEGWIDLTPALVSSWAVPIAAVTDEHDRPECRAMARLYGEENVAGAVFDLMVESDRVSDQGLRTRCWMLLHRLGWRERLVAFVETGGFDEDDLFLQDLHTAATELGIVPHNREEILWLRELCKPEYAEFRSIAQQAVTMTRVHERAELELRDLPILVSAHLHEPELLTIDKRALYDELLGFLRNRKHYVQDSNYDGFAGGSQQRLYEYHDRLTWGDLAAMRIAVRALDVPQVVDHLFDYADRDMADTGTEYGGVMALDEKGRFEIIEFPPRIREHDQKFIAPQAMLDAAYTSLFHFHFHAQRYRNDDYAGPGYGDTNYAENLRANCLVFTFINEDTLNVDYYRHGRVVVDLGVITRPR